MSAFKIQYRGHCQRCGRQQAVKNGTMAHHGYTVRDGWFNGVCSGVSFHPIEMSREALDKTVEAIRKQCAELRAQAEALNDVANWPKTVMIYNRDIRGDMEIAMQALSEYRQRECINNMQFKLNRRAEIGESHCEHLTEIADLYHGKDLIEVRPEDRPEPVRRGDKRILPTKGMIDPTATIIATCTSIGDRGKVYYTTGVVNPVTGKLRVSYTTTRSWRMWAKA